MHFQCEDLRGSSVHTLQLQQKTEGFEQSMHCTLFQNKYGPVGLVHVDAHSDTSEHMYGERVAHGTPFRRAVEEGLLDCNRVVQIGLRGSAYTANDYGWAHKQVC